jgi:hypothetical protein
LEPVPNGRLSIIFNYYGETPPPDYAQLAQKDRALNPHRSWLPTSLLPVTNW